MVKVKKDNRFYVYAFLDPRKPGKYEYKDICFFYEPFYIGKGTGNRIKQHYAPYKLVSNTPKNQKIKKIFSLNLKPIECIFKNNLLNNKALKIEISLIKLIGRKDLKKGYLTNVTDGGEGTVGYSHPVDKLTREKISKALKGKFLGRKLTNEWKEKIGKNNAKYWKGKRLSSKSIEKMKLTKNKNPTDQKWKYRKYKVISPLGEEFIIDDGLQKFSNLHNLLRGKLVSVAQGKRNHHKQWKCEYMDEKPIYPKDKVYLLTSENGKEYIVDNITEFSLKYNLDTRRLYEVARGQHCVHRGWKCELY